MHVGDRDVAAAAGVVARSLGDQLDQGAVVAVVVLVRLRPQPDLPAAVGHRVALQRGAGGAEVTAAAVVLALAVEHQAAVVLVHPAAAVGVVDPPPFGSWCRGRAGWSATRRRSQAKSNSDGAQPWTLAAVLVAGVAGDRLVARHGCLAAVGRGRRCRPPARRSRSWTLTYVGKEGNQPILLPPSVQSSWRTR